MLHYSTRIKLHKTHFNNIPNGRTDIASSQVAIASKNFNCQPVTTIEKILTEETKFKLSPLPDTL